MMVLVHVKIESILGLVTANTWAILEAVCDACTHCVQGKETESETIMALAYIWHIHGLTLVVLVRAPCEPIGLAARSQRLLWYEVGLLGPLVLLCLTSRAHAAQFFAGNNHLHNFSLNRTVVNMSMTWKPGPGGAF